jgi:signal peptidase I
VSGLETNVPASQPEATTTTEPIENETLLESLASICTILAMGLFAMSFIFQNFEIPSGSMMDTLLIGDHVLVDRVTLAPQTAWAKFVHYRDIKRGDIIVFLKPGEPDLFLVKRTIGIPGDRIHLRHGIVFLNGVAQNEPQAHKVQDDNDPQDAYMPYRDDFPTMPASTEYGATESWSVDMPNYVQGDDLIVPPGRVFAMGDNRTHSLDGRFWGFVPRENIVGRPLFVYWSFETPADQIDKQSVGERVSFFAHTMIHIFDQTRWKRTLHRIK